MVEAADLRLFYPSVARNREPILGVLRHVLPAAGLVLELASGSGEHAAYFAGELPALRWQPSDRDPNALASISAHRSAAAVSNLLAPLRLDVAAAEWPIDHAEALVCINMTHISPWATTERLMAGAEHILANDGVIYLYGPYRIEGRHIARSNEEFDAWLRSQNAEWGVRDLEVVMALAQKHGFKLDRTVPMPANNLSIVFRKTS